MIEVIQRLDSGCNVKRVASEYSLRHDTLARLVGDRPDTPDDRCLLEADLDELLAVAKRIRVIRGFEKQHEDGTVLIHIPAFSCALSFHDAAAFLAQSILAELKAD